MIAKMPYNRSRIGTRDDPVGSAPVAASSLAPAVSFQRRVDAAGLNSNRVGEFLQECLTAIRSNLEIDVSFISDFTEGRHAGNAQPYQAMRGGFDTSPAVGATGLFPAQSPTGVPIRLQNGQVYGAFSCSSLVPDSPISERDLRTLQLFADLAAKQIVRMHVEELMQQEMRNRIYSVWENDSLTIVYQPICDVAKRKIVGFEALSRFATDPNRCPSLWFNEASKVGLGVALEILSIKKVLDGLPYLPPEVYLSLNVSPETITSGELEPVLNGAAFDRIVLEITEHTFIQEYPKVERALRPLREHGVRVAVDDAGAGYASFRHILKLAPDMIKLDVSLVHDIDIDPAGRALASAMIRFARETKSTIVCEGIETLAELNTLRELGVTRIQGFLAGQPMPLERAVSLCSPGADILTL